MFAMKLIQNVGITFDDVLMIPQRTPVESRKDVSLKTKLTRNVELDVPIISANMDTVTESEMAIAMAQLGGMGIIHRFMTIDQEAEEVAVVKKAGYRVGAAIGIKDDYLDRAKALVESGCDVLIIDIAHGHSDFLIRVLKKLKSSFKDVDVIAGNIATAQAAEDLIKAGADGIKVGIGPGALCTTRIVTGAGVPQITAINEAAKVAHAEGVPIIADGGIRYSGDIVKALAVGASSVMMGTVLAACEESPAISFEREGKVYKLTRGMASIKANKDRKEKDPTVDKNLKEYAAEGVEAFVPAKGKVADLLTPFLWGVRSGFSYSGACTIDELWKNAEFIRITQSSLKESFPHDVNLLA